MNPRITRILALLTLFVVGCRLPSHAPNPKWLSDFQRADSVVLARKDEQLILSDRDAIDRLRTIYEGATWEKYRDTLPGDLGDQSIYLVSGDSILRRFPYNGKLWESTSYTQKRTAKLSKDDQQFIESLFAKVSTKDGY